MVYYDCAKAENAAVNIMDAQAMVVFKIRFGERSEADDFLAYVINHFSFVEDWRVMQNGDFIGFIFDKMTDRWEYILRSIFQESARYIVRSWHVA